MVVKLIRSESRLLQQCRKGMPSAAQQFAFDTATEFYIFAKINAVWSLQEDRKLFLSLKCIH